MTIEVWWPRLRTATRDWLIANNGDAVPPLIVEEIVGQGGPAGTDAWWAEVEGSPGRGMPDEAVDWIEEAANDEVDGA